jgi:hypothetical protein
MTLSDIPAFCITISDGRKNPCRERLKSQGVNFQFVEGIHGLTSGLLTCNPYTVDTPNAPYVLEHHQVAVFLTHWSLWKSLLLAQTMGWDKSPAYMIIEDDADFHPDWKRRVNAALKSLPDDWEYFAPGNCDTGVVPGAPGAYEVRPLGTHCYIIRGTALEKTVKLLYKVWAPIDLALYYDAFPHMKVFSLLPRCVDQLNMNLNP